MNLAEQVKTSGGMLPEDKALVETLLESIFQSCLNSIGSFPHRKTLYFIRHGRSICNILREQGDPKANSRESTDTVLSQLGQDQAKTLSQFSADWNLDCVVSSPLRRALHTSILALGHLNIPLHVCSLFRETYWEDYESRGLSKTCPRAFLSTIPHTFSVDEAALEYLESDLLWDPVAEDTMTREQLTERSTLAVSMLWKGICCRKERTIAFVTHFGVLMRMFNVNAANCSVYKAVVDIIDEDGKISLVKGFLMNEQTGEFETSDFGCPELMRKIVW